MKNQVYNIKDLKNINSCVINHHYSDQQIDNANDSKIK